MTLSQDNGNKGDENGVGPVSPPLYPVTDLYRSFRGNLRDYNLPRRHERTYRGSKSYSTSPHLLGSSCLECGSKESVVRPSSPVTQSNSFVKVSN